MADQSEIVHINSPKRIVPGTGPRTAKLMIVGEAPGEYEERQNTPFVGPSGALLNDLLSKAGILRSQAYLTNVVKEKPRANNIKPFLDLAKKIPRTGQGYERYIEHLRAEIEEVNPNLILAVGAVPLWALCEKKGITKWRGSILESTLLPGRKVIPTIHPSAALRQYLNRHYILFDLRRARQHIDDPALPDDDRTYILRPSFKECIEYLQECHLAKMVGFDIEVASREVSCISFARGDNTAISIPLTEYGKSYFPPPQEVEIWKAITRLMEDPRVEKIAHNASFDVTFLYRKYGIRTRPVHDTMVAQGILYPDFPKSLAFVTSTYTTMPYYKEEGKEVIQAGDKAIRDAGSQEAFWLYNAKDSIVLVEAMPTLLSHLDKQGNRQTYEHQRALIEPFLYMTERGVRMDHEGLKREAVSADEQIVQLTDALQRLVGYEINPNSPTQLADYFYKLKKVTPYKSRSTGATTTDIGALKRLARNRDEEVAMAAKLTMKIRKVSKLKGTYYTINLDEDKRLRCSIKIVGTKYGRVASSKTIFGTGGNMQNLPKVMKKYMLPDEGYVAYEIDLAQAENRVVAYISGDANMISAFEEGRDIHSQTAGLIFSKPYDAVSDEAGSSTIGGGHLSERDWGKKANHGLNYGMAATKAGYLWEVPTKDAEFVVERYHKAYPMVRQWHAQIQARLKKNRTLENLYGRKVTFMDRWDQNLFMAAYSFIPQSTVADKINRDGVKPLYYSQDIFKHAEFLMQIHDSILFQIPISAGWEYHARVLLALKQLLESPLIYNGREFSLPADIKMLPINFLRGAEKLQIEEVRSGASMLAETYTAILDKSRDERP